MINHLIYSYLVGEISFLYTDDMIKNGGHVPNFPSLSSFNRSGSFFRV